jgi:hypothetical protein
MLLKDRKGVELAAAKFLLRKMGKPSSDKTLDATKKLEMSFDEVCKLLAEFAKERG